MTRVIRQVLGWTILVVVFGTVAVAVASVHGWGPVIFAAIATALIVLGICLVA